MYSFSAPKKFELPLYIGTPVKPVTLAAGEPTRATFVVSLKSEWRVPRRPAPYAGTEGS